MGKMEILATTDTSHAGNDCYINSSVTLVEQFGVFAVIVMDKTTGWFERSEVNVVCQTSSPHDAIAAFVKYGGDLSEQERREILIWLK